MKLFRGLKKYIKEIVIVVLSLFVNVIGVLLIPRITVNIINIGVANTDTNYILKKGALMLLISVLSSVFMIISIYFSTHVAASFASDIREDMFRSISDFPIKTYDKFGASSLIVRTTDDVRGVQELTRIGLRMMLRAPLMFIGGIIMALSTNLKLSSVFFVSLPITLLGIFLFTKKVIPLSKKSRTSLDELSEHFRAWLSGIRVIRAFNKEEFEEENFSKFNKNYSDVFKKTGDYAAIFAPFVGFVMNMTLVGIIYYGSNLILENNMQVGDLIGFIQYANNIMLSFLFISMIIAQIPRAQASLDRINEILDIDEEKTVGGDLILDEIEKLEFKDVSFKYPNSQSYSLKNVSFVLNKGEKLGIIGSTGSGKTTLASLLVRFYDIDSGQILINDRDIKDYSLKSLRDSISYIEQKPRLIEGTVKSNVTMGETSFSDNALIDALNISQADFVFEKELGIGSEVVQRGRNFSGGQKQRISIARAVYKDASLFLIDDSFSALDFKTERKLREELLNKAADRLMILISQRARAIYEFDKILLLKNGELLGLGSHEYLKENEEEYREILESQDFSGGDIYGAQ